MEAQQEMLDETSQLTSFSGAVTCLSGAVIDQ